MAPHNALLVPDILTTILRNLKEDIGFALVPGLRDRAVRYRPSTRDLLSTALCCKAFKDPSLDILWHTVESFAPLLELIPGMQWEDFGGSWKLVWFYTRFS
jgi:hypothetical protein